MVSASCALLVIGISGLYARTTWYRCDLSCSSTHMTSSSHRLFLNPNSSLKIFAKSPPSSFLSAFLSAFSLASLSTFSPSFCSSSTPRAYFSASSLSFLSSSFLWLLSFFLLLVSSFFSASRFPPPPSIHWIRYR